MCNNVVIGNALIHNLIPPVLLFVWLGGETRLWRVGVCKRMIA